MLLKRKLKRPDFITTHLETKRKALPCVSAEKQFLTLQLRSAEQKNFKKNIVYPKPVCNAGKKRVRLDKAIFNSIWSSTSPSCRRWHCIDTRVMNPEGTRPTWDGLWDDGESLLTPTLPLEDFTFTRCLWNTRHLHCYFQGYRQERAPGTDPDLPVSHLQRRPRQPRTTNLARRSAEFEPS